MLIRRISKRDAADWERMRHVLWPCEPGEHAREIEAFFAGNTHDPAEVFIAIDSTGLTIGFAEFSIRTHVAGCETDRVAYLEGWYVEEFSRGKGAGAALVRAGEAWARARGITEMGSDAEIDNVHSAAAHEALGFTEVERVICFRKSL
jgi:aminoglycoside 6'-N-acetyltransferase I